MVGEHNCDNCAKLVFSIIKVDFGPGGLYDECCPEWDDMSDEDTELANAGECPRWEPIDHEELKAIADGEYQDYLDSLNEEAR